MFERRYSTFRWIVHLIETLVDELPKLRLGQLLTSGGLFRNGRTAGLLEGKEGGGVRLTDSYPLIGPHCQIMGMDGGVRVNALVYNCAL